MNGEASRQDPISTTMGAINEAIQNIKADISELFKERKKQTEKINCIDKKISLINQVQTSQDTNYKEKLRTINDKLHHDKKAIEQLEKESEFEEKLDDYIKDKKLETKGKVKYILWIVFTILGIAILANQLLGINTSLKIEKIIQTQTKGEQDVDRRTNSRVN